MATVALAVGSGFAPGTAGFMLAATVGSFIDNMFLMPALFPGPAVEGARVGDIMLSYAEEGVGAARIYGSRAKVQGNIVWLDDLEVDAVSSRVGKRGRGTSQLAYISGAVALCRNSIVRVHRIYADEKPIFVYFDEQNPAIGSEPLFLDSDFDLVAFPNCASADDPSSFYSKLPVNSSFKIKTGLSANSGQHNQSMRIIEKRFFAIPLGLGLYAFYWAFRVDRNILFDEASAGNCSLEQDTSSSWTYGLQRAGNPVVAFGNQTTPNSHMDAVLGADAPVWNGVSFVTFNDLSLERYGNRFPNIEAVLSRRLNDDLRAVMRDLLEDAGFVDGVDFDVSAVSNADLVLGFVVRGQQPVTHALQPLMLAFDLVAQERGGVLYFLHREDASAVSVEAGEVGVAVGAPPEDRVRIVEAPTERRYREVIVNYIDSDNEFSGGSESARAINISDESLDTLTINLGLTLAGDTAREIANRILWTSWADSRVFTLTLPPRYLRVQENDIVSFVEKGINYSIIVTRVDLGIAGVIEVQGLGTSALGRNFDFAA